MRLEKIQSLKARQYSRFAEGARAPDRFGDWQPSTESQSIWLAASNWRQFFSQRELWDMTGMTKAPNRLEAPTRRKPGQPGFFFGESIKFRPMAERLEQAVGQAAFLVA
jgi:hypothetical protein